LAGFQLLTEANEENLDRLESELAPVAEEAADPTLGPPLREKSRQQVWAGARFRHLRGSSYNNTTSSRNQEEDRYGGQTPGNPIGMHPV